MLLFAKTIILGCRFWVASFINVANFYLYRGTVVFYDIFTKIYLNHLQT